MGLRVTSILCAKVSSDTIDVVDALTQEFVAAKVGTDANQIKVTSCAAGGNAQRRLAEEGMVVTAKVSAPGGWSQKKFDSAIESNLLSEDATLEMEEMFSELDGLQEASSGDMEFQKIEGERDEPPEGSSTQSLSDSPTQAPTTSLRGSDNAGGGDAKSSDSPGMETWSASSFCFPALTIILVCAHELLKLDSVFDQNC